MSYNGTSATQETADNFIIRINRKINEFNFTCTGVPTWGLKKAGAKSKKKHNRQLFSTGTNLYWCEGTTYKGYVPLAFIRSIDTQGKKILVNYSREHRGRGPGNPLILEADSAANATAFQTGLQRLLAGLVRPCWDLS